MNRLTKTTMMALAISASAFTSSMAQKSSVKFDQLSKDVYQLAYRSDGPAHIRVELLDHNGTKLLSTEIHKEKSVTQRQS